MNERWSPEYNEVYWIVDAKYNPAVVQARWVGCSYNHNQYCNGNCFKTREEAEAATKKVKDLLLSLHEPATQLPKLTTEVFDRPGCPEWAAVDQDGTACYFVNKPTISQRGTWWSRAQQSEYVTLWERFDASDWENSPIERPAKLPDWCKVGEWVYLTSLQTYKKIADEDERAYIKEKGFAKNLRQARVRPYNAEEMKALVGKMIEDKDGDRYLIYKYDATENTVETSSFIADAEALRRDYSVDEKNAGVLEHLNENGEWVE